MGKLRIVYIHGIHSKPPPDTYRAEWDAALRRLAYVDDIDTTMLYWADIRLGVTISFALHLFDPVIRRITKELLTEIYLCFYSQGTPGDIREVILARMDAVMREKRPDIVIAHSWGTVIAYDYFINRAYDGELPALITLGSPLGQSYVQEHVGASEFPGVRHWLNVFDAMDPATWPDRRIANDLPGEHGEHLVRDVEIPSVYDAAGKRDPHSWFGYLMSEPVQNEIFRIAMARGLRAQPPQNA
jgi:hypothetical protein